MMQFLILILILYMLALIPIGAFQIISTLAILLDFSRLTRKLKGQLIMYCIVASIWLSMVFLAINHGESCAPFVIGSCGIIAIWRYMLGKEIWNHLNNKE